MISPQFSIMLASFLLVAFVTSGVNGEYKITMDPEDKYEVSWTFSGNGPEDEIIFTVDVETTGWVGLGFSPQGSMAGADIIVAWVDKDNKAHLQDMMADSNSLPSSDVKQDVQLISASESDGKTRVTFSRKLNTCDDRDRQLTTDTVRLIYAYSFKDPSRGVFSSDDYHGASRRGSKSIYLFDPLPASEHVPEDALAAYINVEEYEVPADDTTYYCSFHAAPELDRKHHLVGLEPVITPGNEGVVHHMILYACWNVTLAHLRGTNQTEGICSGPEMPEFKDSCATIIYGWAVGRGNYYFPEGTGYALGTGDLESPEFFMLETHYDNPAMKKGVIDSSGLRLVYTPKVRDIDVGMLYVGYVNGIMIPPHVEDFQTVSYCHSSCTDAWIPEEGITIFSYILHAHLLGVKIKVEVFRDGKPGEILAVDNSYDFNYQENRLYAETQKLYPGDELKITCTMDSSRRSEVTYGGESSREEMCLTFLGYYPRQPIISCGSAPSFLVNDQHEIYNTLGVEAQSYPANFGIPFVNLKASFANVSWNKEKIAEAQDVVLNTPNANQCRDVTGAYRTDVTQLFPVDKYVSAPEKSSGNSYCDEDDDLNGQNSGSTYYNQNILALISVNLVFLLHTIL